MQEGTVFNIQRYTIHDGPGMRTELFLKGCVLHCKWCSNPESLSPDLQPGVYAGRCIGKEACGACVKECRSSLKESGPSLKESEASLKESGPSLKESGPSLKESGSSLRGSADPAGLKPDGEDGCAIRFDEEGRLSFIDRDRCSGCMRCSEVCPADAIRRWGERMDVAGCMEVIRRDRSYYDMSGGGVTVSGGEPLLQSAFVRELFEACRQEGIHTCLESTLDVSWSRIEEVLPVTDLVIADLKMMDSAKHRLWTGGGNEQILSNLTALSDRTSRIILRIPVIPGINDGEENIAGSADFILQRMHNRIECLQLLSFMFLGEEKYLSLGMPYVMHELEFDRESFQKKVEKTADYFRSRGIRCTIGTKTQKQSHPE